MISRTVTSALAAVALGLTGCVGATGQQVVDANADVALSISNPDGPVTVSAGAADKVVVSWTLYAEEGTPNPADVEVTVSGEGGAVSVSAAVASSEVWAHLDITAPEGASWSIDSGAGDVVLDGLLGGGQVETTTGLVTGAGLAGTIDVNAALAEVSLETMIEAGDAVTVNVGEGPITVALPTASDATLAAHTDDGAVVIEDVPFSGTNVGGDAAGELGAGATASVTLTTGAGDIRIVASD